MDKSEEKRLDKVRRMEMFLKELMTEGYIVSSGRYFLTGGLNQFERLTEEDFIEIFAEGSKWAVNHETKTVSIYGI